MEPLRLSYRGLPLILTPVHDDEERRIYGYGLTCPKCQKDFFLNTGIGPKPDHHLSVSPQFQINILPEISCPFKCGWRAHVINSIVYQCGNRRRTDLA